MHLRLFEREPCVSREYQNLAGDVGAREIVASGVLDGVEAVLGCHLWSTFEAGKVSVSPGPVMAAADFFEWTIEGLGGHGAFPHETVDPIAIAAEIVSPANASYYAEILRSCTRLRMLLAAAQAVTEIAGNDDALYVDVGGGVAGGIADYQSYDATLGYGTCRSARRVDCCRWSRWDCAGGYHGTRGMADARADGVWFGFGDFYRCESGLDA